MELKLDQWATTPPAGYPGTISPPSGKRAAGFANGEEPPAGYFNHAWDALSDTQNELANLIAGAGLTRSEADLTQVLMAVNKLTARKTELAGITQWVDLYVSPTVINMNAIVSSPLGVLAVGRAATPVPMRFLSAGSYEWEEPVPAATYSGAFYDVCWSSLFARFVAVGKASEIQDSATGASGWTHRAGPGSNDLNACAAGAEAVVAVGNAGLIASTTDGTTWTNQTSAHAGIGMNGVAYSPTLNRFVAVGALGTGGRIQRSDSTGTTWTAVTSPTTTALVGIIWSAEQQQFFAWTTSTSPEVYKSSDGLTWTSATGPVSAYPTPGGISKVVALPAHLAVFSESNPPFVKLYRIDELDGTPVNVVENMNLFSDPFDDYDSVMGLIRVPPGSGFAFAGRLLSIYNSGRIRASHYLG